MAQKTRKSVAKRVKITNPLAKNEKEAKLLSRVPGRNHYNAKQTRGKLQERKGVSEQPLSNKDIQRCLPHGA